MARGNNALARVRHACAREGTRRTRATTLFWTSVPCHVPTIGKAAGKGVSQRLCKAPVERTQARGVGGAGLLRCCFRVLLPAAGVLMRYYLVVVVERRALTGAGHGARLGYQAFGGDRLLALFNDAAFLFHAGIVA